MYIICVCIRINSIKMYLYTVTNPEEKQMKGFGVASLLLFCVCIFTSVACAVWEVTLCLTQLNISIARG